MTSAAHNRKHGDKPSHPIPLWNGVFEHYDRIGEALWEFVWCLDKITVERDGVGLVLGGAPVKNERIAGELKGSKKETIRRHMELLEAENYIRRRRTPYGCVIEVLNSRKFGIWKKGEKLQKVVSLVKEKLQKVVSGGERNPPVGFQKHHFVVSKEDSARNTAVREAAVGSPASDLWEALALRPETLPPAFSEFAEELFASRGDQTVLEAAGAIMDGWTAIGNRIPAPFAKAVAGARAREKALPVKTGVPLLQPEEWTT